MTMYETTAYRYKTISAYDQMIRDRIKEGNRKLYFVNFMFNSLPGEDRTRMEIMRAEVTRFHDILKRHVVRNPNAPAWREFVPVLVGCPDFPVAKLTKVDARLFQVNGGLHFNAIVIMPPRRMGDGGGRRSRLRETLVEHVRLKNAEYRTDRLARIHVTPLVPGTTMTDYTFKAYKRGRITSDEILLLN